MQRTILPIMFTLALTLAATSQAKEQAPQAEAQTATTQSSDKTTDKAADTSTAKVPDLSKYDRDTLLVVCKRLYHRVGALEKQLTQATVGDAPSSDSSKEVQRLKAQVARLAQDNKKLRRQLVQLARKVRASAAAQTKDQKDTAPPVGKPAAYRYTYTIELISKSGKGHLVIRDENGKHDVRYSYDEYRDDAIDFHYYFRNTSKKTCRYSFMIGLVSGYTFVGHKPLIIGTATSSTPYLAPGEVYEKRVPIKVNDPDKIKNAGIGHVVSVVRK